MYSIYADEYLIYDSRMQDYVAMDPKLTLKRSRTADIHAAVHKSKHKPHYEAQEQVKGIPGFHSHIPRQDY